MVRPSQRTEIPVRRDGDRLRSLVAIIDDRKLEGLWSLERHVVDVNRSYFRQWKSKLSKGKSVLIIENLGW